MYSAQTHRSSAGVFLLFLSQQIFTEQPMTKKHFQNSPESKKLSLNFSILSFFLPSLFKFWKHCTLQQTLSFTDQQLTPRWLHAYICILHSRNAYSSPSVFALNVINLSYFLWTQVCNTHTHTHTVYVVKNTVYHVRSNQRSVMKVTPRSFVKLFDQHEICSLFY